MQYQVAISFAGEQRNYAEELARHLSQYGIAYFYDAENQAELWGKHLAEEFQQIYSKKSQYVLMLLSRPYLEKQWCRHERRTAIAEGLSRSDEFILPVRFDDAWPVGIPTDLAFVDGAKKSPAEVVALIAKKLKISLYAHKASDLPPPKSASWLGDTAFDYQSFNGRYVIGDDEHAFETAWGTAGRGTIHVYNEGRNINGVAVAYGVAGFKDLPDASQLDFSSRHRGASQGDIVVFRNNNGLYAALKIQTVTIRNGTLPAELRFWYAINRDGSSSFTDYSIFY